MWTLVVESGKHKGRKVKLASDRIVVGRAEDAQIRVGSTDVSRHHCELLPTAHGVLVNGESFASFRYVIGAQVLGIAVLLCGPLLMLTPLLLRVHAWGTFNYGRLAAELGHHFQRRWLGIPVAADSLGAPDFSATTDLYAITSNVRSMSLIALDLGTVRSIAVASLLPYVPIVLATRPLEEIFDFLLKAFM